MSPLVWFPSFPVSSQNRLPPHMSLPQALLLGNQLTARRRGAKETKRRVQRPESDRDSSSRLPPPECRSLTLCHFMHTHLNRPSGSRVRLCGAGEERTPSTAPFLCLHSAGSTRPEGGRRWFRPTEAWAGTLWNLSLHHQHRWPGVQ